MESMEGTNAAKELTERSLAKSFQVKLRVRVSGEHYDGPPEFRVLVDGRQEGGLFAVAADFRKGEWEEVSMTVACGRSGPRCVEIEYLNDYSGGSWQTDRNLLVDYLEVDGTRFTPEDADYDRHWQDTIRGQQRMAWGGRLVFHPRMGRRQISLRDRSGKQLAEALNRGPSRLVPEWTSPPAATAGTSA